MMTTRAGLLTLLSVFVLLSLAGALQADDDPVTLIGSADVTQVRAEPGQERVEQAFYEPSRGYYTVKKFYLTVRRARDAKENPLVDLEGRRLEITGRKKGEVEGFLGRDFLLTGKVSCGRYVEALTFSEVPMRDAVVGCNCVPGEDRCTYELTHREAGTGPGGGKISTIIRRRAGAMKCLPPEVQDWPGWVSVKLSEWRDNQATVTIEAQENRSAVERSGTVRVGWENLVIKQAAPVCSAVTLSVPPDPLPPSGGELALSVTVSPADCEWRIVSAPPWIRPGQAKGCGSTGIRLAVAQNPGATPRSGVVALAPSADASKVSTVNVSQQGR